MNCFGPKKVSASLGVLCWWKRQDTLQVKDAVTKKKSQSTTVIFNYFPRKQMANLISFCNMPIIYMILNNKDLITWSLRGKLRSTERKIKSKNI
jgi:hypothetical protein